MNANQLLTALDSITVSDADGRRLCAETANNLRAAIQVQTKVDHIEAQMSRCSNDNQGIAQYDSLKRQRDALPDAPLAAAMTKAKATLEAWQ